MGDSSDSDFPRGVWSDSSTDDDDDDEPSLRQRRDAWADRIDALRAACETATTSCRAAAKRLTISLAMPESPVA